MIYDIMLIIMVISTIIILSLASTGYFNPPDVKKVLTSVCYEYNNSTIKCFKYTAEGIEKLWNNEKEEIP